MLALTHQFKVVEAPERREKNQTSVFSKRTRALARRECAIRQNSAIARSRNSQLQCKSAFRED